MKHIGLGSSYVFSNSIHSSERWMGTPHYQTVQSLLSSPLLILIFCTVSLHQFSLLLPQVRLPLSSLLPIPTPSLFSHLQGDLNKGACRDSFFQSVMLFLVLLCFVPVALPQSMFCRFSDKAAVSTYHRPLLL